MQELFDSHKVIFGGPFIDDTGGIAIVEVNNEEEHLF